MLSVSYHLKSTLRLDATYTTYNNKHELTCYKLSYDWPFWSSTNAPSELSINDIIFSINKVKVEVKVHIYIQMEPTAISSYVTYELHTSSNSNNYYC